MPENSSLDPFLNRRTIFIKDIDTSLNKQQIREDLTLLCPPTIGRIVIPVDKINSNSLGCAYCNFNSPQLADQALRRWRHRMKIKGKPVRMMFAIDSADNRERVFGAWGLKFIVMVSHLGPDIDTKAVWEKFEAFGEILHCKVETDQYGQTHGMVHYVEESSVKSACAKLHRTPWNNTIIHVEPHRQMKHSPASTSSSTYAAPSYPTSEVPASSSHFSAAPGSSNTAAFHNHVQQPSIALPLSLHEEPSTPSTEPYTNGTFIDGYYTEVDSGPEMLSSALPEMLSFDQLSVSQSVPQQNHEQAGPSDTPALTLRQSLLASFKSLERLGDILCCPITQELLRDPVMAADGYTYERVAIESWLEKNITSPMTNEVLASKYVVPNILVRVIIENLMF